MDDQGGLLLDDHFHQCLLKGCEELVHCPAGLKLVIVAQLAKPHDTGESGMPTNATGPATKVRIVVEARTDAIAVRRQRPLPARHTAATPLPLSPPHR